MELPRTLLLTLWPPDAKYKVLYKNVALLPSEQIRVCTLQEAEPGAAFDFEYKAFIARDLHWRVTNTSPDYIYRYQVQSRGIAKKIAEWAAPFEPEVLWVLPELGAASVGHHLMKQLNIPLHLTIHDAHETAKFIMPRVYYTVYAATVRKVLRAATSLDVISDGMQEDLESNYSNITASNTIVIPPCVSESLVSSGAENMDPGGPDEVRRVVLCGSMRVTLQEWAGFLELLSALPFPIEIVAYAYPDLFHDVPLPNGVTVKHLPFAETEAGLIADFHANKVHACYLGLYCDPARELFSRTSLSAKLTTYAAAGLPIIVHGPAESAAWKLVESYSAGVRVEGGDAADQASLKSMFTDEDTWRGMARGAARLCRERFNLGACMESFAKLLCQTASH